MARSILILASLLLWGSLGCAPINGSGNENGNTNDNVDLPPLGEDITVANEGAAHLPVGEQVTYIANPPASGSHWSQLGIAPVAAGFYEEQLEEEQWVHNLEHGYVVVLYDCGEACTSGLLKDLEAFFDNAPPSPTFGNVKLVVTQYTGLPYLVTAVAWDVQRHFDAFDEAALIDFYEMHVDMGPEAVP